MKTLSTKKTTNGRTKHFSEVSPFFGYGRRHDNNVASSLKNFLHQSNYTFTLTLLCSLFSSGQSEVQVKKSRKNHENISTFRLFTHNIVVSTRDRIESINFEDLAMGVFI